MTKDSDRQLLQTAKDKVSACDRCGTCLTVCPLFAFRDVEKVSARGKNAITRALAEGAIEPAKEVLKAVDFCLLCRSCVDNCPNKVETDEAMLNVRQYLANRTGGATVKYRLLGGIMKRKGVIKLAAAFLALLRKAGLHGLVPFGMLPEEYTRAHFLAAFAGPAALGQQAALSDVEVTASTKVAYFQGCGMKLMFPEAAADTLAILETTTRPLIRANACCGIPHLAHGLREDFLALAKENIALYEDANVVVTDCASCGGTLKHLAAYFADEPQWQERALAFSRKVMDFSEYLVKVGYRPRQRVDAVMTYHDPCHLARGQGIKRQPRELLRAAGNFVEMKEADLCCGGAGTFHMDYPGVSGQIVARKQQNIIDSGAAVVVSGCPVCLVQMGKAAKASGGKFKVMHISQVV